MKHKQPEPKLPNAPDVIAEKKADPHVQKMEALQKSLEAK